MKSINKRRKKRRKKKQSVFKSIKTFFKNIKRSFFDEVEEEISPKTTFSMTEVILIVLISILFGVILGYFITYSKSPIGTKANPKVSEMVNTYNNIINNYYDKVDQEKLGDAAIKGMMDSLEDPYSNYMDQKTTFGFNETVDGSFVGIGTVVQYEDSYNKIIEVYKDSPAEKAGLKVDDIILEVNGKNEKGVFGEDLVKQIRGKKGTKVKIKVKRGDTKKTFMVKRGTIDLEIVTNKQFNYEDVNVGYIKINSFASNSNKQFDKAIKRLDKKNVDGLIIDVRDNPGGHLQKAREILSYFFKKDTILYQIETKTKRQKIYSMNNKIKEYPVVILANEGSASASEILITCFRDNYKNVVIVGNTTYGKDTVQKSQNLSSGSSIKYTTERWLTSKGKALNGKGIKPDVEVDQSEEYYENPNYETDKQLQEGLKQLKNNLK